MFKKIVLIYLLIISSHNLFSQKQIISGKIRYEVFLKFNEKKVRAKLEEIKGSKKIKEKVISQLFKNQPKLNFELIFNENESTFEEVKKMTQKEDQTNMVRILAGNGMYYTNKTFNKILNQKEAFGQFFLINTPKMDWVLTQEKKKIGSYICYKATTEKEVENTKGKFTKKVAAWYTPDIPINYAPKDYFGLPGLILELEVGNLSYKASKIDLSFKDMIKIRKPTKGKKVTLLQYNEIVKKMVIEYRK